MDGLATREVYRARGARQKKRVEEGDNGAITREHYLREYRGWSRLLEPEGSYAGKRGGGKVGCECLN